MPNIFDGIEKISDAEVREQIAVLESINMINISKPMIGKVTKNIVKVTNKLGVLMGKSEVMKEPDVKSIWELVEEKRSELEWCKRNELDRRFKKALVSKTLNAKEDDSLDAISVEVINEASKLFDISEELTPGQKADIIKDRFTERMLINVNKKLKKQNSQEAKKTIEVLENSIRNMNDEQREDVKKALGIEKLTGETIRAALLKAGAPAAILAAVSASGFGAFVGLTTIIHAVFTTVMGITLPFAVYTGATSTLAILTGPVGGMIILGLASYQIFNGNKKLNRELLVQIVWFAVTSYGEKFAPKVPWESLEDKIKEEEIQRKYDELVREKEKIERRVSEQTMKIKNLEKQQERNCESIEKEKYKREQAEKELYRLKVKKEELEKKIKDVKDQLQNYNADIIYEKELKENELKAIQNELEKTKNEIIDNNIIIEDASDEIKNKQKEIEKLKSENYILKIENNDVNQELNIYKEKVEKEYLGRRRTLIKKWNIYFDKCKIDEKAIRDALDFSVEEVCSIEKVIFELQGTNDPKALSGNRGKLYDEGNKYEHIAVKLHNGQPGRIKYDVLSNEEKKIRIMEIYKHSQKRFS